MRLLLDSNVLIPLEPTSPEDVEGGTTIAAELVGLTQGSHTVLVHPDSLAELSRDSNSTRRDTRAALARKYVTLDYPPTVDGEVASVIGVAAPGSRDEVDDRLLAAVVHDAVDLLVTEDADIHRKARLLGAEERVIRVRDAVEALRALLSTPPTPPPFVEARPAHTLNESDSIFESFRNDYTEFDDWLRRTKRQGRTTWVIEGADGDYAGICIVKPNDDDLRLGGHVLKVSSLKVADQYQGNKYGELLLKMLFTFCHDGRYDATWLSVFPHHQSLITLVESFGFERHSTNNRGELCYAKRFTFTDVERDAMDPLDFHVTFGPPAIKPASADLHVIPIQPRYHQLLFPEIGQQALPVEPRPFGNAIRKAYLCNAASRQLKTGSTVLFYRSGDQKSVTCVGIVETTIASRDPVEIARLVGQRTVYRYEQIEDLCKSEVLVILFRQDRVLDPSISANELVEGGALLRAPQSITKVRSEGEQWLITRINE